MMNSFHPKCVYDGKQHGHSSMGFICPCCYLDPLFDNGHVCNLQRALFTEDLKICNNDSIDDILSSEAWTNFYKAIYDAIEDPSNKPPKHCMIQCTDIQKTRNSYYKSTVYKND